MTLLADINAEKERCFLLGCVYTIIIKANLSYSLCEMADCFIFIEYGIHKIRGLHYLDNICINQISRLQR
jgi:hypothetical protein